jgi:tRNA threonylcarbamoyladenosine biosynthesis protein TsaE
MAIFTSHNPAETIALGEQWGREAQPGWVIGLSGDLGAGKTLLAGGIARGLGISARIVSPTFPLVAEYSEGRLPCFHLDLYRLGSRVEIAAAGLELYLSRPRGVTVAEWIERWLNPGEAIPGTHFRRVEMKVVDETVRIISYEDFSG